jgi:hypothetical protein
LAKATKLLVVLRGGRLHRGWRERELSVNGAQMEKTKKKKYPPCEVEGVPAWGAGGAAARDGSVAEGQWNAGG